MPASKSVTNRELILSAIADGRSRLELGPLDPGDDVRAMRQAIQNLGHQIEWDTRGQVTITGAGEQAPVAQSTVQAHDAGTVARFGAALAALGTGRVTIDGSAQLRRRPVGPLLVALRELGVQIEGEVLPLSVTGPLRGGRVSVSGTQSSQFASALLLTAPRMELGLTLQITGRRDSAPFIELTLAALEERGVKIERLGGGEYRIARQRVKPRSLAIPGDVSASTYPAAAAAILGGQAMVENVDARLRSGSQGDARFFSLLREMGCVVNTRPDSVTVRRVGPLRGITSDVRDCSDVFPTLAVIAAFAESPTELVGIGHTRHQESDRIAAVAAGLRALGGVVTEYADAIRIEPAQLHSGVVDAAGDHRIAMAFSIVGLQVPGVAIEGAEAVSKTFPGFYEMLNELAR